MTLPASGSISSNDILTELRRLNPGRNYPLSTLDADVLVLVGKSGPPVKIPDDFYGKTSNTTMSGSIPTVYINGQANPSSTYSATGSVVANIVGGTLPLTYAWSRISGGGTLDAVNSNTTTARFTVTSNVPPGITTQQVQLVVTDSGGKTLTIQGQVVLDLG